MNKKKDKKNTGSSIAVNKKARHDYTIESTLEAGLVLEGWEVKSIRAGRVQLKDSYVDIRDGEAWLKGTHISPLNTVCTHITADPMRHRKCLLHQKEITKFIGLVQRAGYTLVPLNMHWKKNKVKLEIGLAKGKTAPDKRASAKDKDWSRQKQRLLKNQL